MARYIDADKLLAHLQDEIEGCRKPFCSRANGKSVAYGTMLGLKSAISFAETLSTADVAPKSEVAREIFAEIEKCMEHDYISTIGVYNGALKLRIAELKKKYTEGDC